MYLSKASLLFCLVCACGLTAFAQRNGTIKGCLKDSVSNQVLKDASVVLLHPTDSTLVQFTLSKDDASFALTSVAFGNYLLQISFQGFETVYKPVVLTQAHPLLNFDTIYLRLQVHDLGNVTVGELPIQIKKDTVMFNAGSFKTRPYAALEELLKKIPGMQVEPDGSIKMNGEAIQQLLVDGKPFFGGDPQTATKNLPADIVDKVQVYNASSDQKAFTGFDNGSKQKTINITIKKNKRKGDFGNVVAAGGSQSTYNTGINLNHFNGSQQLSLIAQSNNINSLGINMGSTGDNMAGMSGINRASTVGLNYRDQWGKNTSAYGSYTFSHQHTTSNQDARIQNIFPGDSSTLNNQSSAGISNNDTHRMYFNIEEKLDSANSLLFRPNVSVREGNNVAAQQSLLTGKNADDTIYQSTHHSTSTNKQQSVGGSLLFRHLFKKKFRTFSVDLNVSASNTDNNGYNNTQTDYFTPRAYTNRLDQHFVNSTRNTVINPTISYTEPIAAGQAIELVYKYRYNNSNASNQTFQYNTSSQKYDVLDSLQSNHFENVYHTHNMTVNYRFDYKKYHITAGAGVQADRLKGNNITKDSSLQQHYFSVTPSVLMNYYFKQSKNLQFNYNGTPSTLSIQQLQPVQATADSLYIQKGNPHLKQPFTHNFSLSYNTLNMATQRMFSVSLNASITRNAVQNAITQLPNGAQVNTPVNINGTYFLYANVNYSMPLKRLKSTVNFLTTVNYQQTPAILNNEINNTRTSTIGEGINWQTNISDRLDLSLSAATNYNIVHYAQQQGQQTNYLTEQLRGNILYYYKSWTFSTNFYYTFNNSLPAGFKKGVPLVSPAVARQFFKNKAGELRLSVFDLLNQNIGISRSTTANTIQDTRSLVRSRYVLLSFTYNLRRFGGR